MAVTTPSDTDLVRLARAGDETALTELYLRHRAAALRLARSYGPRSDADDLVSGAFERVMAAIRRGGGPEPAFRPYLYVTSRRLAMAQVGGILLLHDFEDRHRKLIYFTGIDQAKFRRPVVPGDQLRLEVEILKLRSWACKLRASATVEGQLAAEADILSAMVDREAGQ